MNSSYSALCCDTVINITPAGHYTTYLYFALWQIWCMIKLKYVVDGERLLEIHQFLAKTRHKCKYICYHKHICFWRQHVFDSKGGTSTYVVLPGFFYVRRQNCIIPYFFMLRKRVFQGLGQDSELVSGTPWWPAALDPTIACGAVAPQPSAQAPSTHHGRRGPRLEYNKSTGGTSGEYHHHQRNYFFFWMHACC